MNSFQRISLEHLKIKVSEYQLIVNIKKTKTKYIDFRFRPGATLKNENC